MILLCFFVDNLITNAFAHNLLSNIQSYMLFVGYNLNTISLANDLLQNMQSKLSKFAQKLLIFSFFWTKIYTGGLCMENVLFIGDSITDAGTHVALVDTFLRLYMPAKEFKINNIGLCSENTSALTEAGHPCERPNIAMRIDKILDYYNIDRAIIMYGINDAIYKSFSEERFSAFKSGMTNLVTRLRERGVGAIYVCTPSAFDPLCSVTPLSDVIDDNPIGTLYSGYNSVMSAYAEWIRTDLAPSVDKIVDINAAMNAYINEKHASCANFSTGDGIHPNLQTSAVLASAVLHDGFGFANNISNLLVDKTFMRLFKLVRVRDGLQHDFDKETIGHTLPWHARLLPREKLDKKLARLDKKIAKALQ